ncbi:Flavodoxin [Dehalobacter sp. UNSWDHB]|uniref:NAD(P)H-dependent oxidoreductase n=1 Tax=Dehalobacter sp. UNSWDHB TaxID=1339256 RepID=UPI0003879B5F|nr:NAD(P)H-dependent oxidoreductase [Dehalobacter sp. UNSWDHB]EQB22015.1 Flavodoxin [Dehalobacter sp. UNSWDHB]
MHEETVDYEFVEDSQAVIIGTPAYAADLSWQLKKWFDTDWNCSLAGKLGATFATQMPSVVNKAVRQCH